ncbi:hypothetical protein DFP72DRAFT_297391, partial [Ephemerocybe angulata]
GLPRYSDKYRPSLTSQPALKRKELHAPFFPSELLEDYFNPKRRKKTVSKSGKARVNIDELLAEDEEEKSDDERSDAGSQNEAEDYDVDEEDDNDYAGNYFDNGEATTTTTSAEVEMMVEEEGLRLNAAHIQ